jgi:hypothetical protein
LKMGALRIGPTDQPIEEFFPRSPTLNPVVEMFPVRLIVG